MFLSRVYRASGAFLAVGPFVPVDGADRSFGALDTGCVPERMCIRNFSLAPGTSVWPLASFITRSFYRCSTVSMLCALSADACHAAASPLFGGVFFAGPVPAQRIDLPIERARSHLPNALLLPLLRPCPFALCVFSFSRVCLALLPPFSFYHQIWELQSG